MLISTLLGIRQLLLILEFGLLSVKDLIQVSIADRLCKLFNPTRSL